ncbi:MAG: transcription-repair coupling factor, partial [Congregibacter sp.]|nr:transcription-repair coupling factor [Congregibacter sp.]
MFFAPLLASCPWPSKKGSRTAVGPFFGSTASLCIAELAAEQRLLVIVTEDTAQAQMLARELPFFLPDGCEILQLPDWETLPYDNFSPHQDIVSERLRTLHRLPTTERGVLLLPVAALMQRLPPRHYIEANSLLLAEDQALDVEALRAALIKSGYHAVDTVYEHGEFAVRGSLMDIYPMGSKLPLRIDLLDDQIDSLRSFDPETQRTIEKLSSLDLLPAREFPLDKPGIKAFQQRWYARFDVDHDQCPIFTELSEGRAPGGAEYYLPLFFDACESLLDYLPPNAALLTLGDHYSAASRFWDEASRRFTDYGVDPRRPLLSPAELFTPVEELFQALGRYAVLELRQKSESPAHIATGTYAPPQLLDGENDGGLGARLKTLLAGHSGAVLLCAETQGRREILLESLDTTPQEVGSWDEFIALGAPFALAVAPIDRGINLGPEAPMLITETQLFGERVAQRRRRRGRDALDPEAIFRDLNELRQGSPVVHAEHGIGRYA